MADSRRRLVALGGSPLFTAALMQGSGTFSVEAAVGSMMPPQGKLLALANGAYGGRIAAIARTLRIPVDVHDSGKVSPPDIERLRRALAEDPSITHVAVVHCANKCIQGVPGFGFLLVHETLLPAWKGQARSLALDVYISGAPWKHRAASDVSHPRRMWCGPLRRP